MNSSEPDEADLVAALPDRTCADIYFDWSKWARPAQLPPEGDWTTWLLIGGRGAGKTRAGAEWVRMLAASRIGPIALVGETITEAIAVMIEGPSGLMAVTPPWERPKLNGATLHWPNGVEGTILGAADPDRFRGPQFAAAWCDEAGCGAVDRGANQPNVFVDPKSSESGVPYFSSGASDPLAQRQVLRALLGWWDDEANNPTSDVYDGRMLLRTTVWTWDARPYPAFPALTDVWSDGPNHVTGHWLTGRLGGMASDELMRAVAADSGATLDTVEPALPFVHGYVVDAPMTGRAALAPLLAASGLDVHDTAGGLRIAAPHGREPVMVVDVVADDGPMIARRRPDPGETIGQVALGYLDRERSYQLGSVTAIAAGSGPLESVSAGLVLDLGGARSTAERLLGDRLSIDDSVEFTAPPSLLALEVGDAVMVDGDVFAITEIRDGLARRISARTVAPVVEVTLRAARLAVGDGAAVPRAVPVLDFAQLPPLPEDVSRTQLALGTFASPWPGTIAVADDLTGTSLATLPMAATMGELTAPLVPGSIFIWDEVSTLELVLYSGHLSSRDDDEVLAGANRIAVATDAGDWEIVGFSVAELIAPQTYRLTRLLRGQGGTDWAIGLASAGNRVLLLDGTTRMLDVPNAWLGTTAELRSYAGPSDPSGTLNEVPIGLGPILPLAPVHLCAVRAAGGDIALSWVRRSRADTDSWVVDDAPLDISPEAYRVTILNGVTPVRTMDAPAPAATYSAAQQTTDFGAPPASFGFTVAQLSPLYGPGHPATGAFHA